VTDGLLLIHAFPLDARMWDPQVRAFRGRLPVVAPDLPGFGDAPMASGTLSMASAAQSCLQALEEADVDRAVVCGLSMGGYVALELWRAAPQRVAGLVLANTRSQADSPEGAEARRRLADRLYQEGNVLVGSPPPLLSELASGTLRDQVLAWISDQAPNAIAAAALAMASRREWTPDLPGIDVPTMVITADLDQLIPADVTAPMADEIPGAQLHVIEGAGHLSNLEAPDRFNELLGEHLRRCGVDV
jgi:pimeloyl-ACP methyl ester carboxylesterase